VPPVREKPEPETEPELIVTADEPVDDTVIDCVAELPTATLPKLKLVPPSDNCGFDAVPVPLKDTVVELPVDELLVIVSCPLADPAAVGLNVTDTVSDWFGFSVTGKVPATSVNAAPLIEIEFTVTGPVPEDVSVRDCVVELPTATLPKLRLVPLSANVGVVA